MTPRSEAMTAGQAYRLLGLPSGADAQAVSRAFRGAVKTAHPDLGGDAEQLRLILEAHRVLKSVSGSRASLAPSMAEPAPPRVLPLRISVQEALFGGRRRLELDPGRAVELRLPEGLRSGDVVRLAHADGQGAHVLLGVWIAPEPGLGALGGDLWMDVEASRDQLGPGARLRVQTPRGPRVVAAPEGLADGARLRLKGEGLPARGPHPAGDLILKLKLAAAPEEPASQRLRRRFAARWAA